MPSVHAGMQCANYTTGINRTDTTFLKHLISLLFVIILINEAVKNNNRSQIKVVAAACGASCTTGEQPGARGWLLQ